MSEAAKPAKPAKKKGIVSPQTLKGFRDYLPAEMILRNRVIGIIRGVFEKYGFMPIDTPILEHLETLVGAGGEEINKELFCLESPEGDPIAMRFDLTVPFARVVAQYLETMKLPFRRYHIAPVFRADKPGPGRFRQFTQCDIDAAGSTSVAVDAEIIAAMCEVMVALGLTTAEDGTPEFQIRVNNRKLVDALLEGCGITDMDVAKHVLRVVDKLGKVGVANVRLELGPGRIDDSGDPIKGVGLPGETIEKILSFIAVKADSRQEMVAALTEELPESKTSADALQEMADLALALDCLGVSEGQAAFDPSLARGLDYYTGPVYEGFLPIAPEFGSVMGGGRYDGLVTRFMNQNIPSAGMSIGLDRLLAGLQSIGKLQACPTTTEVLIINMKWTPDHELLKVARELREAGIPTEVYMGARKKGLKDQLSYANNKEMKVAVILGPDEIEQGIVSVKNLDEGKEAREQIGDNEAYREAGKVGQQEVKREELVGYIKALLNG